MDFAKEQIQHNFEDARITKLAEINVRHMLKQDCEKMNKAITNTKKVKICSGSDH